MTKATVYNSLYSYYYYSSRPTPPPPPLPVATFTTPAHTPTHYLPGLTPSDTTSSEATQPRCGGDEARAHITEGRRTGYRGGGTPTGYRGGAQLMDGSL